jgi:hypothetical protein
MMEGMEAGMCSCDFDGEPYRVWKEKERRARKTHRCDECDGLIKPGEMYYWFRGFCDSWEEWHVCLLCEAIRRDYCAPLGCLREELKYALGFDYVTGEEVDG